MDERKRITITLDSQILEDIDKLVSMKVKYRDRSQLVELALLDLIAKEKQQIT